jgi:hypothetical protein
VVAEVQEAEQWQPELQDPQCLRQENLLRLEQEEVEIRNKFPNRWLK